MRLAAALRRFWERGPLGEGRTWLEAALQSSSQHPTAYRADALGAAGRLASLQGDYANAGDLLEEARGMFAAEEDHTGLDAAVADLAWITLVRGDYERSGELWEQALSLSREADDKPGVARALTGLARGLAERSNRAGRRARPRSAGGAQADRRHARCGQFAGGSRARRVACGSQRRSPETARRKPLSRAGARRSAEGSRVALLLGLAGLREALRDSIGLLRERLELCQELGDRLGIAECLDALGGVAAMRGDGRRAGRLGAADGVRQSIGAVPWRLERSRRERDEAAARTYLDSVTF